MNSSLKSTVVWTLGLTALIWLFIKFPKTMFTLLIGFIIFYNTLIELQVEDMKADTAIYGNNYVVTLDESRKYQSYLDDILLFVAHDLDDKVISSLQVVCVFLGSNDRAITMYIGSVKPVFHVMDDNVNVTAISADTRVLYANKAKRYYIPHGRIDWPEDKIMSEIRLIQPVCQKYLAKFDDLNEATDSISWTYKVSGYNNDVSFAITISGDKIIDRLTLACHVYDQHSNMLNFPSDEIMFHLRTKGNTPDGKLNIKPGKTVTLIPGEIDQFLSTGNTDVPIFYTNQLHMNCRINDRRMKFRT